MKLNRFLDSVNDRIERLILTTISKKGAWAIVATVLCVKDLIDSETWALFVATTLGIGAYEKVKGVVEPSKKYPQDSEIKNGNSASKESESSED